MTAPKKPGRSIPQAERHTVVLQLRMQPELAERLRRLARETGQTLARVVEAALDATRGSAMEERGPEPTIGVMRAASDVMEALAAYGLGADVSPDALGGLAIYIGDAERYVWISLLNSGARTVTLGGAEGDPVTVPLAGASIQRIREHVVSTSGIDASRPSRGSGRFVVGG